LRLALLSILTAVTLAAAGYFPTMTLAERGGIRGMYLGLGAALTAALAGLVPPLLAAGASPHGRLSGMLASMALRLLVMLGLLLMFLLSGWADKVVLAIWAVVGYIVLLTVDTVGLWWLTRRDSRISP
jgi:hypothetical protein